MTIAFLHAHPDDEAIFTGGTLARLAAAGHRTVVVVATSGELGRDDGHLEPLASRRRAETESACTERAPFPAVPRLGDGWRGRGMAT